ncbi:YdcF family protein [Acidisoma sp. C75]
MTILALFYVSKLLWLVFEPSVLLLILGCAGLGLVLSARRGGARAPGGTARGPQAERRAAWGLGCISLTLGAYAAIALLPIGSALLQPLENRFPPVRRLPADVTGIIVLGGAVDTAISAARGMPSLNSAAERMTSLLYLARAYPQARLAFTGGNGRLLHGTMTEADVARAFFTQQGLDQRRIVYESRSRTTYENALFLKQRLGPKPGQTWLLVTSAWHMPRAVGLFRHAGWDVLPYPVGYKTMPGLSLDLGATFPDRLAMTDLAAHEWLGLFACWLMGRTSALFPAPHGRTPR